MSAITVEYIKWLAFALGFITTCVLFFHGESPKRDEIDGEWMMIALVIIVIVLSFVWFGLLYGLFGLILQLAHA